MMHDALCNKGLHSTHAFRMSLHTRMRVNTQSLPLSLSLPPSPSLFHSFSSLSLSLSPTYLLNLVHGDEVDKFVGPHLAAVEALLGDDDLERDQTGTDRNGESKSESAVNRSRSVSVKRSRSVLVPHPDAIDSLAAYRKLA